MTTGVSAANNRINTKTKTKMSAQLKTTTHGAPILTTEKEIATLAYWNVSQAWHRGRPSMTTQDALHQLRTIRGTSKHLDVLVEDITNQIVYKGG